MIYILNTFPQHWFSIHTLLFSIKSYPLLLLWHFFYWRQAVISSPFNIKRSFISFQGYHHHRHLEEMEIFWSESKRTSDLTKERSVYLSNEKCSTCTVQRDPIQQLWHQFRSTLHWKWGCHNIRNTRTQPSWTPLQTITSIINRIAEWIPLWRCQHNLKVEFISFLSYTCDISRELKKWFSFYKNNNISLYP